MALKRYCNNLHTDFDWVSKEAAVGLGLVREQHTTFIWIICLESTIFFFNFKFLFCCLSSAGLAKTTLSKKSSLI